MREEKSGLGVEAARPFAGGKTDLEIIAVCPTSRLDTVGRKLEYRSTYLPMNRTLGLAPACPLDACPWRLLRLDEERAVRQDSRALELALRPAPVSLRN